MVLDRTSRTEKLLTRLGMWGAVRGSASLVVALMNMPSDFWRQRVACARSPFFSLPSSIAVSIASGIVPDDVFPYFSMLMITRSGSIPSRSAVAVIILLFAWCGIKHPRSAPVTPFRSSTFAVASAIFRTANL